MATILLSAVGAAAGGVLGGGAFGLSSVVIGRAIGATIGRSIDQRLMGGGSETVETGKMDRLRVLGSHEGGAIANGFGRMRVSGNVIWASRFKEKVKVSEQRGGKGGGPKVTSRQYSYCVSIAIALCEGEISRVGRIWADGAIVPKSDLNMTVYRGTKDQLPDPVMSAIEGEGNVPAYRGLAYVVLEDLNLSEFGNRVPQLSFEVVRHARSENVKRDHVADLVRGVALLPGSGEFALATTPAYKSDETGNRIATNINNAEQKPDLLASLDAMAGELPKCKATSLVVSWFGDDLRVGRCMLAPKVEQSESGQSVDTQWSGARNSQTTKWEVSGTTRANADVVPYVDGAPVYGGTPSDSSVIQAVEALRASDQEVMFYPFILMEQLAGNTLTDPYSGAEGQPALPWRGRITTERAPGIAGSTDKSAAARAEVAAFMGMAAASDFDVSGSSVTYTGAPEQSYRRFILHYAHLCAVAGGVDAFCIGSEMRGLTRIQDENGAFPAVEALRMLASDIRSILGPDTKIGYAADWSEYSGYQPQDGSGDLRFPLDRLWASEDVDFIGIDNYMPISDWRDGDAHLDADAGSIYDLEYLKSNIRGGEGYDWYYGDDQDRALQIRRDITDGAHDEPWVYRYKDLWNWWGKHHHERIAGSRATNPTDWEPSSKPIWFTELGCAAINKGTNQPNKFLDAKSSESALPRFSNGRRDDYIQMQYLRAYYDYFANEANNPISPVYGASMVDMSRAFVWAWDARPWPDFPANLKVWKDGENHLTGHWITGRTGIMPLAHVVAEICERGGVTEYDVSALHGIVRGYSISDFDTPRAGLQPLMITYGFDAFERGGALVFQSRADATEHAVLRDEYVVEVGNAVIEEIRAPAPEVVGDVRIGYTEAEGEFAARVADARFPGDGTRDVTQNDLPLALTAAEASGVAERWLAEARVARDTVSFALPPSRSDIQAGNLAELSDKNGDRTLFRVDRIEDRGARKIEAVRVEKQIYEPSEATESVGEVKPFSVPVPVSAQFLDLPLLKGDETPHAPYLAVRADPWPGGVALYSAPEDNNYQLNTVVENPSGIGLLQSVLEAGVPGLWQRGSALRVQMPGAPLSSVSREGVLNGANAAAIGDGSSDNWEIIQFAEAQLVAPETYELDDLLRGQAGSDGLVPGFWPVGSRFVLLDGAPQQVELDASARGLARHYRVGPSLRPYDDPSYQYAVEAFAGIGLRPYPPAHLRTQNRSGDWHLSWVRRTRIDGDSWASVEVPLGEDVERYLVRVSQNGAIIREAETTSSDWIYTQAMQSADAVIGAFEVEVAQVSLRFGPGLFARIELDG